MSLWLCGFSLCVSEATRQAGGPFLVCHRPCSLAHLPGLSGNEEGLMGATDPGGART